MTKFSHHPHQTDEDNNVQNFQLIWHLVLVTDVVHGRSNWSPRLIKGDPVDMEVRHSNDDQQMISSIKIERVPDEYHSLERRPSIANTLCFKVRLGPGITIMQFSGQ